MALCNCGSVLTFTMRVPVSGKGGAFPGMAPPELGPEAASETPNARANGLTLLLSLMRTKGFNLCWRPGIVNRIGGTLTQGTIKIGCDFAVLARRFAILSLQLSIINSTRDFDQPGAACGSGPGMVRRASKSPTGIQ